MRSLLIVLAMSSLATPTRAQEMIEVPTDPNAPTPPTPPQPEPVYTTVAPTVPAPSASAPIPAPVTAPLPAVRAVLLPAGAYRMEPKYDLVVGGVVMFGVSYGIPLVAGAVFRTWYFAVPLAGPLLAIADIARPPARPCTNCGSPVVGFAGAGLAIVTLAQVAGIALVIAGFKTRHRIWRPLPAVITPAITSTSAGISLQMGY